MNIPEIGATYENFHNNQLCKIFGADEEWVQICLDVKFVNGMAKNGSKKWDEIETGRFLAHWHIYKEPEE